MAGGVSFVCPAAFFIASGPWISFALANATALGLSADQMAALLELRHRFHVELRRPGVDAAALRRDIMRRAAALLTPEQPRAGPSPHPSLSLQPASRLYLDGYG